MKNRFITAAMLLGMMALSSSCVVRVNPAKLREEMRVDVVSDSIAVLDGDTATKLVNLKDFNEIASKGAIDVYFRYSDEPRAEILASKDVIDNVRIDQKGDKVSVKIERRTNVKNHGIKTIVRFYSPSVKSISLAGAGSIEAESLHESEFSAAVAGSGDVKLSGLDVKDLEIAVAGSGDIVLNGRADHFEGAVAGSGDIDIRGLECDDVETDIAGSGKVIR